MSERRESGNGREYERPRLGPSLVRRKLLETVNAFHFKLWLVNLLLAPLPILVGKRFRAALYRLAGFQIGRDSRLLDRVVIDALCNPYANLKVGRRSQFGIGCHISLNAPVTIGDNVIFGHYVRIITDTHSLGPSWRRCGERLPLPVTIEDGAWIASNVVLLPGVRVGSGSVVASGAVVRDDVPADTLVAGVPAAVVRRLPGEPAEREEPVLPVLTESRRTIGEATPWM